MEASERSGLPWASPVTECCGLPLVLEAAPHTDRYEVLERVAKGGMAEVFAAWDRRLQRRVAMKVCRSPVEGERGECLHCNHDAVVATFAREIQILSQFHHSSIIPAHDIGLDGANRLFFTMPLLGGTTFLDAINAIHSPANGGRWSMTRALPPLLHVCDALRYAHSKGVVHGDVKPSNIMVGSMGETFLIDWGLAEAVESPPTSGPTTPSSVCIARFRERRRLYPSEDSGRLAATPSYAPLEYLVDGTFTTQFDVYSFGAVLYHLLSGQPPYGAEFQRTSDLIDVITSGPPAPLDELAMGADPELIRVCARCMARDPAERYSNMGLVREDLNEFVDRRFRPRRGLHRLRRALVVVLERLRRI